MSNSPGEQEQRKEMGRRIHDLRVTYKLSMDELAQLIGISSTFLNMIECGYRSMKLSRLITVCETFNVSLDYLVLGKNEHNEHNIPQKIADNPILSLVNTLSDYELKKLCDFGRIISLKRFTKNETDSLFAALNDFVIFMKRKKRGV